MKFTDQTMKLVFAIVMTGAVFSGAYAFAAVAPDINAALGNGKMAPEYLPIKLLRPQFPRRAVVHDVNGYVILELTVAADGSVLDDSVKVIEAEPEGYFEKVSIKAVKRFKYVPKIVNGKPAAVPGVRYKFTFRVRPDS
ncbi:MAG: energy transducer TonB [Kordiimonadaceae bacterium]|nr:energy transducer TonB [Kordiimonadaceae bacterium]